MTELIIFVAMFVAGFLVLYPLYRASEKDRRAEELAAEGAAPAPPAPPHRAPAPQRYDAAPVAAVAPPRPQSVQSAVQSGPEPITSRDTWRVMMRAVHLLIVGETESGKSTSARAVLAGRIIGRDRIVILDPHSRPSTWGGMPVIGGGRNFDAIGAAMLELLAEMTRRYERLATNDAYTPEPLTIFVDEWPAIRTNCPKAAAKFITELAQEGRKAGMRLVMLTQSDLVASLGIEGKGDVRGNFTMLLLGTKAIDRCPTVLSLPWPAALRKGEGEARAAYTTDLPAWAQSPIDVAAAWSITRTAPPAGPIPTDSIGPEPAVADAFRRFLNNEEIPIEPAVGTSTAASEDAKNAQNPAGILVRENAIYPDGTNAKPVPVNLPNEELSVALRALVQTGMSRNKIIEMVIMPGGRADKLKRIKMALGEAIEEAAA